MTTTANMSLVMPTEGGSDDIWDTILNTLFGVVDAHDHSTGKGVPVPSSGLRINADVPWAYSGTSYSITALKAVDFTPVTAASVAALAGAFFVSSADNELYFRSIAGTNIKLTAAGTINVSLVGGIGGDYSSVGALLDYDDATDTYRLRQETSASVRQYAKLGTADILLREYDAAGDASVPAETVTIKSPDALAASYSVTFPAAVPGATAILQATTAGVLTFSNTIVESITLASTKTITLAGTAARVINSAPQAVTIPLQQYTCITNGTVSSSTTAPGAVQSASVISFFPIPWNEHYRKITSVEIDSAASANNTIYSLRLSDGATAAFAADITGSATTTDAEQAVCTPSTPAVLSDGITMWIRVETAAGSTRTLLCAIISYTMT